MTLHGGNKRHLIGSIVSWGIFLEIPASAAALCVLFEK